ncbi:MAG: hypothetical protein HFH88_15595 [Lachnospiraceae bacterium]|nr:hypothetical protein [Lachnospiraceae bacterium]
MANIFHQMGFIEAWGTGIRRIKQAAERYGLPSPEIQIFDDMFRVNLYRRPLSEISDDSGNASEKHRRSPSLLSRTGVRPFAGCILYGPKAGVVCDCFRNRAHHFPGS